MASLSIHLLGPPRLERAGVAVHLSRRRTLALTLYLALTGEPHHRERLTALFWPESEAGHGRANLRRALHQINQALGEGWLISDGETLSFRSDGALWLDVHAFRQILAASHGHGHADDVACPRCMSLLAEAVDLYRNDFLAGFSLPDSPEFDEWQYFQGEALRDELASALERLVHGHAAQDQYDSAIAYARRRLALDALHEPTHRWLMQLYAWDGRQAAALGQYEQCVRLLAQELDMPPAPETEQLYQAIKARRLARLFSRPSDGATAAEELFDDDIRVVTVLCAGLSDETAAESVTGLDALAEATQQLQTLVEDASAPYTGRVEHVAGEAFLVFFGVDQGHEDDAERGVRAADAVRRTAQKRGLSVHIGVDTGMAYCRRRPPWDVTVMGTVVNRATRLRNRAEVGQILVGRTTYLAARGLCDYVEQLLMLAGQTKPLPAFAVLRLRPQQVKARGPASLQAPLAGREKEMAILRRALDRVRAGEGGMIALTGEAGAGKSRLVTEIRQEAAMAHPLTDSNRADSDRVAPLWLEGRAMAFAADIGFWLFADLLRSHFGETEGHALTRKLKGALSDLCRQATLRAEESDEIGPLLAHLLAVHIEDEGWNTRLAHVSPDQVRRRTLVAVRRFLTALATVQPLVLVLEDLHWADRLSLETLGALITELDRATLLILCLFRPKGSRQIASLALTAGRMVPGRFIEVRLRELTDMQCRQMVFSLLADDQAPDVAANLILKRAEGNPLFLEEIVRRLIETGALVREEERWFWYGGAAETEVPVTLQSIVLGRVDSLAPDLRQTLQAASVFGRVFRPRLLASLLPDASTLDEAMAYLAERDFIYLDRRLPETEYSFQHVLVQEAIYQGITQNRRTMLHRRAGDALARVYAGQLDPFVEQLARHYELGGEPEKAVTYLLWSGRKAQQLYLNDTALAYFLRALALVDELEGTREDRMHRLAALRGIGEVGAVQGSLADAEPALRQAMDLAAELELPATEQVRLYFPLCQLLRWLGRLEDLFVLGQEGLALLGDDAETDEAVMLITYLATGRYLSGQRRQYRQLIERVSESLRARDYGPHLVNAYSVASWWYRDMKRTADAFAWIERLDAEAQRRYDRWTLGYLRASPGYWLPEAVGDFQALRANMNRALTIAEEIGDPVLQGYALTYFGHLSWGMGDLDRAEAMYRDALAIHTRVQALHLRVLDQAGLGWVRLCRGDLPGTIEILEQALADAASTRYRVHGVQMARLALARAYEMSSRQREAAELYQLVAIEDEADSDGQAWMASALAGLERVLNASEAFQAACHSIRKARRADDPLPLVQWQLNRATPEARIAGRIHRPRDRRFGVAGLAMGRSVR